MLVTQRTQGLTVGAQQRGTADENVFQEQVARPAAIHGGVLAHAHALAFRVDQEQADALFVTAGAGNPSRNQKQSGALPSDDQGFAAIERPAALHRFGAGLNIVQLVVALRFVKRRSQLQHTAGDLRQQFALLLLTAQLVQQSAGQNH
ncbi:hypothetical protein D9M73_149490 [compost metagenome]